MFGLRPRESARPGAEPAGGNANRIVSVRFVPRAHHIGFPDIVHGGALAMVLDEAMVWAASWSGKRFCLCGEMSIRFRAAAEIEKPLTCSARVDASRARLITTSAEALEDSGRLIASASGKYVPLSAEQNRAFIQNFIDEPSTAAAADALRHGIIDLGSKTRPPHFPLSWYSGLR